MGLGAEERKAALAGIAAAGVWAAAEPLAQRVFRTGTYSDVRALDAFAGRHWRVAGTAIHLANGAAAGIAFHRIGLRGPKAGVIAAAVEHAAVWPGMALIDRFHPDRRSGAWPPLLGSRRVFAQEAAVHLLFGFVLGSLVRRKAPNS